mgnify:CR=1 FL=1
MRATFFESSSLNVFFSENVARSRMSALFLRRRKWLLTRTLITYKTHDGLITLRCRLATAQGLNSGDAFHLLMTRFARILTWLEKKWVKCPRCGTEASIWTDGELRCDKCGYETFKRKAERRRKD